MIRELDDVDRQRAEAAAATIMKAEEPNLSELGIPPLAIRLLARAYSDLRMCVRALHDLVDQTDPADPIGVALTAVGLEHRPPEPLAPSEPRLVFSADTIRTMSTEDLLALYCHVMHESIPSGSQHVIVRCWDGMDGCWTDCTGDVPLDDALRLWAERTDGGTRRVAYSELDYYRIFPGGTRMHWDGRKDREMHR